MQSSLLDHALDDEFAMHLSSPARAGHRRTRSDPSDILQSIRAERSSLLNVEAFQSNWMSEAQGAEVAAAAAPADVSAAEATADPLDAPAGEKLKRDLADEGADRLRRR